MKRGGIVERMVSMVMMMVWCYGGGGLVSWWRWYGAGANDGNGEDIGNG